MSSDEAIAAIDAARVAVLAYRNGERPVAIAVTPFVEAGRPVVTSTLALIRKMELLRLDGRCELAAGGFAVRGDAVVSVDRDGDRFARELLAAERKKYPPTDQLSAIPFSRRLLWWYFGRVFADIDVLSTRALPGDDRVTFTTIDDRGYPRIEHLDTFDLDPDRDEFDCPNGWEGPAVVLAHEEHREGADLRQLALHGHVEGGRFRVTRRTGTLAGGPAGLRSQLVTLNQLRRAAIAAEPRVEKLS